MGIVTAFEAKTRFGELLERVSRGEEIVITRHRHPVARLSPIASEPAAKAGSPAAIRSYWRNRQLPPPVRSAITHAELIAEGHGEV